MLIDPVNCVNPASPDYVRVIRYIVLIIFILLNSGQLIAQDEPPVRRGSRVIDDTTKQIYGPTTSRYFLEKDVFYNQKVLYPIDTVIRNFHRFNYVQRNNNLYQDLGFIGSAIRPVFYEPPAGIGVRSGFHAYDLYWETEHIQYFDTKSPYSNMYVVLGGKGRSMTRATFSRNINPRWNFGITYRGLFIDKQIPERRGKGDRAARSQYYSFFTAYQSKDSAYSLFANFKRNYHQVDEYGGVIQNFGNERLDSFFVENVRPWLTAAQSSDLRMNFHLFHQYRVGNALQLYHISDRYRQANRFIDADKVEPDEYYLLDIPAVMKNDSALDVTRFKTFRNEVGVKGNLSKLFYNGYYAIRHFSQAYNHILEDTLYHIADQDSALLPTVGNEMYLGGRIALRLDSLNEINGWLETMNTGNYRFQGQIKSKWFDATLTQLYYKPGFLERAYRGSHHDWENSLKDIRSTQLNGYLYYRSKPLTVSPGITFTRLQNYVVYTPRTFAGDSTTVAPFQLNNSPVIVSPELRVSITLLRHIHISNHTVYTKVLEDTSRFIRIPTWFINTQLAYANIFFKGNLDMHAGVDVHWKSSYFPWSYDPAIQQFYVQENFEVKAFPVIDIFLNAKIKRGRIFLKYNNLLQALTKEGYLPTPYYPGQRNIVDFGFDWSFYD